MEKPKHEPSIASGLRSNSSRATSQLSIKQIPRNYQAGDASDWFSGICQGDRGPGNFVLKQPTHQVQLEGRSEGDRDNRPISGRHGPPVRMPPPNRPMHRDLFRNGGAYFILRLRQLFPTSGGERLELMGLSTLSKTLAGESSFGKHGGNPV